MDHKMDADRYFMRFALRAAKNALARNEFPVGCVLVHENRILAAGSRQGTARAFSGETDHAEIVALRRLYRLKTPVDRDRIAIYTTMEPCLMCYGAMLISGIGKLVYAYEDVMGGGTRCDLSTLPPLYRNADIETVPNIRRRESLALFRSYFSDPENNYWKGSLLADYTLGA